MKLLWFHFRSLLMSSWFLWILFIINLFGSIYGFYWYKNQLAITEPSLIIFVPDSPTASAFFTMVLLLYLLSRRSPLMESFASITLFKYGIWAVVMIIWGGALDDRPFMDALTWQHWMLIGSHLGMAAQALLYSPFYTYGVKEILIVSGWTLLNDGLDYGLKIHPWVAPTLEPFIHWVGWFTFILSLVTIFLFTILQMRKELQGIKS
ncbi:DUF1405 domain-containing protein [Hazenella coriacea]|uniref:Putative membrane protein YpjA n=1 Tax=Hazenella coriacea TaxID=1179467 RepID=A0A4R3L1D7_9BACL|nr:DUF1405 domain-containing protein [Hazenella coriacea]TCS93373.1 putative membrane protein YpjA [Hazenella coriacea]